MDETLGIALIVFLILYGLALFGVALMSKKDVYQRGKTQ